MTKCDKDDRECKPNVTVSDQRPSRHCSEIELKVINVPFHSCLLL